MHSPDGSDSGSGRDNMGEEVELVQTVLTLKRAGVREERRE